MRVITGLAKGHKLVAPAGDGTRPPLDRQKEALFSMLAGAVEDARVLDLFAGSGSFGIEALSRGAASAVFVDSSPEAEAALKTNLEHTKLLGLSHLIRDNVISYLKKNASPEAPYDLIFLDPPFRIDDSDLAAVFETLRQGGYARANSTIVLRLYAKREPADWPGFSQTKNRAYGDSRFMFYQAVKDSSQ
jgi:16S rRNA (guanine(966)-N(2))-methyltransferase RsmD